MSEAPANVLNPEVPVVETPAAAPAAEPGHSIYGDLAVKWPEGMDDTLRNEPGLKPFVDAEGNLNTANLLKSYVHTKKSFGEDRVKLPNENSSKEELDEFWGKMGHVTDREGYKVEKGENDALGDDFRNKVLDFAHENRVPVETASKMMQFMNDRTVEGQTMANTQNAEKMKAGIDSLRVEYGQAYDLKTGIANRVLREGLPQEVSSAIAEDPNLANNPAIIKALVAIGEKFYAEDGVTKVTPDGLLSPDEASRKINEAYGDKKHPFQNSGHPDHARAAAEVQGWFKMGGKYGQTSV